uniref:Uncharacterized protein n=1 Tax=Romanomermis culicivorax TaxID=13658 RepID=A0A915JG93_ROMCU
WLSLPQVDKLDCLLAESSEGGTDSGKPNPDAMIEENFAKLLDSTQVESRENSDYRPPPLICLCSLPRNSDGCRFVSMVV